MILFFDTETTGKPKKYNAPITDLDNWPRLVQLGYMAFHDNGTPAGLKEYIIKPEGFVIPKEASDIHGITQEIAEKEGIYIGVVLASFRNIIDQCHTIAGHNIEFDRNVMGAEFLRRGGKNPLEGKAEICTMKSGTDFCKLPKTSSYGTDKYKWPRLSELYKKLFGVEMGAAHTALQDTKNASECYFEMKSRGII